MNKTAQQIKTESLNNGVEEWFLDEISDNCLVDYTVEEIIDLYESTQKQ